MIFIGDVMKKAKKRIIIVFVACLILLISALVADHYLSKSYLIQINYNELMEKIEKKESFVLLISQTTCSHCMNYKPKLKKVANKYEIEVYYIEFDLFSEDEKKKVKENFNFEGTPQTIFVINGQEKTAATRIDGETSEEKIISKFKSNGFIG